MNLFLVLKCPDTLCLWTGLKEQLIGKRLGHACSLCFLVFPSHIGNMQFSLPLLPQMNEETDTLFVPKDPEQVLTHFVHLCLNLLFIHSTLNLYYLCQEWRNANNTRCELTNYMNIQGVCKLSFKQVSEVPSRCGEIDKKYSITK